MNDVQIVMITLWGLIIVTCLILELVSTNFISMWFSVGGIAAIILAAFQIQWYWQVITFAGASGVNLAIFYPILRRKVLKKVTVPTNIDSFIGKKVVVERVVNQFDISGYTKINGATWAVKLLDPDLKLKVQQVVVVRKIDGILLYVEPWTDPELPVSKSVDAQPAIVASN